jgi:glycosyltransferase involved in cell wall biosynthesis
MKNVLILAFWFRPSVGGAETHVDDLCEFLIKRECNVTVLAYQPITMKGRGLSKEKGKNLEIRRFRWIGFNLFHKLENHPVLNFLYLTPYFLIRSFWYLIFNFRKFDVIHAQGLNASFVAMILKKIFRIRAVMSTQALYNFKKGSLFANVTKYTLNNLDEMIVESGESKQELIAIGVPEKKIKIFSHWVNQDKFKPTNKDEAKEKLGWGGKFVVLFVGRAIPQKGARALLQAAEKVNEKINFAFITAAGPVIEEIKIASQKKKNIIFVGQVNYADLYKYYVAADIFCIPSQYEEGVARVMLEAVSCGIPIVGSNRGSIPSVLDESVSILVDPTAENLAEKIEYLFSNQEKLKKMADNCWPYAENHFGFKNAQVILNSYE